MFHGSKFETYYTGREILNELMHKIKRKNKSPNKIRIKRIHKF